MKHDQKGFIDADAVTTTFVVLDPVVSKEAQSLIEPYRKDAACWQFARKELSWSRAWFKQVRWAMYIEMDAPTITAGRMIDDSVARELDAAVLAAIAAKGGNT